MIAYVFVRCLAAVIVGLFIWLAITELYKVFSG